MKLQMIEEAEVHEENEWIATFMQRSVVVSITQCQIIMEIKYRIEFPFKFCDWAKDLTFVRKHRSLFLATMGIRSVAEVCHFNDVTGFA